MTGNMEKRIHNVNTAGEWRELDGALALPIGPGYRLRRNQAKGAFPPFGFNR